MLLRLQSARVNIDQAGEFREPHHAVHRFVGDVRLTDERHHVVLAVRIERDVAHQHEIVVLADLAEGAIEHVGRALAVTAVKLVESIDHPPGGIAQAFAIRIVASIGDERAHGRQRFFTRRLRHDWLGGSPDMIG